MNIKGNEGIQIVGRFLIDEIQPVVIEEVSIAAPYEPRLFLGIIVGIIIFRKIDGKTFLFVSPVFPFQGAPVVFEMAEDEYSSGFPVGDDVDAVFFGPGKDYQI